MHVVFKKRKKKNKCTLLCKNSINMELLFTYFFFYILSQILFFFKDFLVKFLRALYRFFFTSGVFYDYIYIYIYKLIIRSNDRLIRENQFHHPPVRSKLQDLKQTTRLAPNRLRLNYRI